MKCNVAAPILIQFRQVDVVTSHIRVEPATVFLWLLVVTVGAALYAYAIPALFTVLLVIGVSFFLGLLVFALILSVGTENSADAMPESNPTGVLPVSNRRPPA
ncbi:MAG TPA: hypothetical protein VG815_15355, partial [Chloroflexota bacterium]|nr:hypothetical protein [Chloroflexota bacterium]